MRQKQYRLSPRFIDLLGEQGYTAARFSAETGFPKGTLNGMLYPQAHRQRREEPTMQAPTAQRLARAYAQITGLPVDQAYSVIIVEEIQPTISEGIDI